jgi:hypothetical protein
MPLSHGKSAKAFGHNVAMEMHHGKPLKQSLAIAYSMKRKAQHKAHGGKIHDEEMASGYLPMPEKHEKHNAAAMHEEEKHLNQHMAHGGKMHHMAKGGMAHDEKATCAACQSGLPHSHHAHGGDIHHSKHMAHGGESHHDHEDVVGHILKKLPHYSEGGRIANDDHHLAGLKPNEFDDLALRDDLEDTHNTGKDDGDYLGNAREDHDRHDVVAHILKSMKKKDRLPHPA